MVQASVFLFDTVRYRMRRHSYRPPAFSSAPTEVSAGGEPEGRRRRYEEDGAGPDRGSEHQKGTARAALKVEAYRLRPEGLAPAEMQHDFRRLS